MEKKTAKLTFLVQNFSDKLNISHRLQPLLLMVFDLTTYFLFFSHSVDEYAVSEYFPLPHVWKTLCEFAEDIFNIKVIQKTVPTWHEDVVYYEVSDGSSGERMGGFYMDAYTRFLECIKYTIN